MKEVTTERQPSRIDRILEVHPYAREVQVRAMLVAQYDKVSKDPSTRGPDGIGIQMEAYTDVLCRFTEHAFRNELARVGEQWGVSWDELEDIMRMQLNED